MGRRRVWLTAGAVAAAAVAVAATAAAEGAGAPAHVSFSRDLPALLAVAPQTSSTTDNLPSDCIPVNPLPGQLGELGTVAVVGPPYTAPGTIKAGSVAVAGIELHLCGIVTLTQGTGGCPAVGTVTIPVDGQKFTAPLEAGISIIPGVLPEVPVTPVKQVITGSFACSSGGSASMGLTVQATAHVGGSAGLFGLGCSVVLSIPLTASVTGPITVPFGLRGDFTNPVPFPVPAVQPSATCPEFVSSNLNSIVGLPLTAPTGSVNLPFAASIYAPS